MLNRWRESVTGDWPDRTGVAESKLIRQRHSLPTVSDSETTGQGVALGVGVDLALGVAVGVAIDNIGLGIGVGMALGAALGLVWDQREA